MAPTFAHRPLGQRIPASPHAVSCSLPTMRDVCGYEERDEAIVRHITSGYPRFVVHPFARELASHVVAADRGLRGRVLWLTSSAGMARQLLAHLGPEGDPGLCSHDGLHGVSHLESSRVFDRAKTYLQNIGGFLSSREAEDHQVRLGLRPAVYPEAAFDGDAAGEIERHLRQVLPGTADTDLHLANCGMNAMYAAFRAVSEVQAARGRTVWLQIGWLYLDTIAILPTFTASPGDYVYVRDVFDLPGLAALFDTHGPRLAGVIAEVPTNALVQTPDLPALAALCGRHGARLLVDPSIASVYNVDVLPFADVVVSSLTKYTGSEGDLTAGFAAVNPAGPDASPIRDGIAARIEPLYPRDAARLAWQIGETPDVLSRIHASTPQVVAFLEAHPAVKDVYWALHPASRDHYLRLVRTRDAVSRPAPLDGARGRPLDEARGRPLDGARGRPLDEARGRPLDEARGRPLDEARGRPLDEARGREAGRHDDDAGRHDDGPTPPATGGMVTFTLRQPGDLARVYDRLRLPKGPSFGMKTTLVCPFMYLAHYDLVRTASGRAGLVAEGLDPDLLRLCVGTEPVGDIIAALAEALD